jgi:hydrogenase expression/formation protein HypE
MLTNHILLDHGSGGKRSYSLIRETVLPIFNNPVLSKLDDGATLDIDGKRLAFSTDTYVVDPIFFPGGNIGDLAINGTVNDLAMCGAIPLYLSVGLIIEEGLPVRDFKLILETMGAAAKKVGIDIVTGDTKVVPKTAADKLFINTSGIGKIPENVNIGSDKVRTGDHIILSGAIAEHGIAILTSREGLTFETTISSDTAPLPKMVQRMFSINSSAIHALRDPTRGGVGTALNEIAIQSEIGIKIFENNIPVREDVMSVCDLLGLDPLYIANEGKLLAFVSPDHSDRYLAEIRKDEYGKNAAIIGEVVSEFPGKVFMETAIGGSRIVDMLAGEQLPRIC